MEILRHFVPQNDIPNMENEIGFKCFPKAAELCVECRQCGDFEEISQTGPQVQSRFFVTAFLRMT
jgi:hypothetical protein